MNIIKKEQTLSGLCKITVSEGSAFFIREDYLKVVPIEKFQTEDFFEGEESEDIVEAGLITTAECKAVEYLSRAEHCRAGLLKKLLDKGFSAEVVNPALDYLEKKNYLSDLRFCRSWLNSRKINHNEGRKRLEAELMARGISREVLKNSLDEFFEENDENEIIARAYEKLSRKNISEEKLISSLLRLGFSYKTINHLLNP